MPLFVALQWLQYGGDVTHVSWPNCLIPCNRHICIRVYIYMYVYCIVLYYIISYIIRDYIIYYIWDYIISYYTLYITFSIFLWYMFYLIYCMSIFYHIYVYTYIYILYQIMLNYIINYKDTYIYIQDYSGLLSFGSISQAFAIGLFGPSWALVSFFTMAFLGQFFETLGRSNDFHTMNGWWWLIVTNNDGWLIMDLG